MDWRCARGVVEVDVWDEAAIKKRHLLVEPNDSLPPTIRPGHAWIGHASDRAGE
jgi:hypothetical protein